MSEAPGYAFAVSMAVASTMVAGFALATLVTVSGGTGRRECPAPGGQPATGRPERPAAGRLPGLPRVVVRSLREGNPCYPQAHVW